LPHGTLDIMPYAGNSEARASESSHSGSETSEGDEESDDDGVAGCTKDNDVRMQAMSQSLRNRLFSS
jgi:hypothetical protein